MPFFKSAASKTQMLIDGSAFIDSSPLHGIGYRSKKEDFRQIPQKVPNVEIKVDVWFSALIQLKHRYQTSKSNMTSPYNRVQMRPTLS